MGGFFLALRLHGVDGRLGGDDVEATSCVFFIVLVVWGLFYWSSVLVEVMGGEVN